MRHYCGRCWRACGRDRPAHWNQDPDRRRRDRHAARLLWFKRSGADGAQFVPFDPITLSQRNGRLPKRTELFSSSVPDARRKLGPNGCQEPFSARSQTAATFGNACCDYRRGNSEFLGRNEIMPLRPSKANFAVPLAEVMTFQVVDNLDRIPHHNRDLAYARNTHG